MRFVAPGERMRTYEIKVYETGRVETRPDSLPRLLQRARLARVPAHQGAHQRHARRRDPARARTPRPAARSADIFDEGGAIVQCDDAEPISLLKSFEWKSSFGRTEHACEGDAGRVFGHAVLEKALEPWPGISCKVIVAAATRNRTARRATGSPRLPADASPRLMPPLPDLRLPRLARRKRAPCSTTTRATSAPAGER